MTMNRCENDEMQCQMLIIDRLAKFYFHSRDEVKHDGKSGYSLPSLVTGIEQVVSARLLGITFSHNVKFDEHVKNILTICNQRSYLLKCLKGQDFPSKELHTVFCALIVSHILYALPAWRGFWLLSWLAKLMLICVKPSGGAIMAILKYCLNFFMMQIWNCLEVYYIASTVFTCYFLHWSVYQWNFALLTVLLLSPTATKTCTNIYLFCDVFFHGAY